MTSPDELIRRLREHAQNDEMIDNYFTQEGRVCNEAAAALEAQQQTIAERDATINKLRRGISKAAAVLEETEAEWVREFNERIAARSTTDGGEEK